MSVKGYTVAAEAGIVFGRRGRPVGKLTHQGYLEIRNGATRESYRAHRIIWEAVHGPIPADRMINHINGVRSDNRISNLELVTPGENLAHAYRIGGRSAVGECNGRAKLCASLVLEMRRRHAAGERIVAIAREMGISKGTAGSAIRGWTWKHL